MVRPNIVFAKLARIEAANTTRKTIQKIEKTPNADQNRGVYLKSGIVASQFATLGCSDSSLESPEKYPFNFVPTRVLRVLVTDTL